MKKKAYLHVVFLVTLVTVSYPITAMGASLISETGYSPTIMKRASIPDAKINDECIPMVAESNQPSI